MSRLSPPFHPRGPPARTPALHSASNTHSTLHCAPQCACNIPQPIPARISSSRQSPRVPTQLSTSSSSFSVRHSSLLAIFQSPSAPENTVAPHPAHASSPLPPHCTAPQYLHAMLRPPFDRPSTPAPSVPHSPYPTHSASRCIPEFHQSARDTSPTPLRLIPDKRVAPRAAHLHERFSWLFFNGSFIKA